MKNQKGVTLIALVITIIVLIILAAVSLAMLTGKSGILTNAQDARDNSAISTMKEKINLVLQSFKTDIETGEGVSNETISAAEKVLSSNDCVSQNETTGIYTVSGTADDKTISGEIDSNGTITPASEETTTNAAGE